jgi:hypothetical protein
MNPPGKGKGSHGLRIFLTLFFRGKGAGLLQNETFTPATSMRRLSASLVPVRSKGSVTVYRNPHGAAKGGDVDFRDFCPMAFTAIPGWG